LLSPAFGVTYIQRLEPLVADVIQTLFKTIDKRLVDQEDIELDCWKMCLALAFDVIGTTAFGKAFGMVERGSHPIVTNIQESLRFMMVKLVVSPWLLPLFPLYKHTIVIAYFNNPK